MFTRRASEKARHSALTQTQQVSTLSLDRALRDRKTVFLDGTGKLIAMPPAVPWRLQSEALPRPRNPATRPQTLNP